MLSPNDIAVLKEVATHTTPESRLVLDMFIMKVVKKTLQLSEEDISKVVVTIGDMIQADASLSERSKRVFSKMACSTT